MEDYLNNAKKRRNNNISFKKVNFNFKPIITKFLLATIFFLVSIIYTNMSDSNLLLYKEYVLTESMPFTKIKGWYEDLFGEVLPKDDNNKMVMNGHLVYKSIDKYMDGEVLTLSNKTLINNLTNGIVVFIGEKDNYGNTIIIQGADGADVWYGNITNVSVKLYDYVEKDKLIGETKDDKLYLVIKKDNEYIKYEDYQV